MQNALFTAGAPNAMLARAADDARADGGRRMILLAPRCVTIRRRLRGVKMQLLVPVDSYKGIVLSREDHPSGALFILRLSHRDPELSVTLLTSNNRSISIEAWHRGWLISLYRNCSIAVAAIGNSLMRCRLVARHRYRLLLHAAERTGVRGLPFAARPRAPLDKERSFAASG
jgi:hypothetical protein